MDCITALGANFPCWIAELRPLRNFPKSYNSTSPVLFSFMLSRIGMLTSMKKPFPTTAKPRSQKKRACGCFDGPAQLFNPTSGIAKRKNTLIFSYWPQRTGEGEYGNPGKGCSRIPALPFCLVPVWIQSGRSSLARNISGLAWASSCPARTCILAYVQQCLLLFLPSNLKYELILLAAMHVLEDLISPDLTNFRKKRLGNHWFPDWRQILGFAVNAEENMRICYFSWEHYY